MAAICYEQKSTDITSNNDFLRISYTRCTPPIRLRPKGTVILLHDFFRTSYQFRYVTDLFAMGGYITIAPDFPGTLVWPQHRQDARISHKSLTQELSAFIEAVHGDSPVHLVGSGFGALMALQLAASRLNPVQSVTCNNLETTRLLTESLHTLCTLPPSCPTADRISAFKAYLGTHPGTSTGIFEEDIAEYAEAFSKPEALTRMQMAARSTTGISKQVIEEVYAAIPDHNSKFLLLCGIQEPSPLVSLKDNFYQAMQIDCESTTSIPEGAPEHFALTVLSFLNCQRSERDTALSPQQDDKAINRQARL